MTQNVDSHLQHQIHFFEGYRERMLENIHGGQFIEDIDIQRYSPGSARRYSYDEGRKSAESDITSR